MTRDDNRDGVGAVGHADGANRLWVLDAHCQLQVTNRLAVRNTLEFAPHGVLKWRALERHGRRKLLQPPGEILIELLPDRSEHTLYIRLPGCVDLARARYLL